MLTRCRARIRAVRDDESGFTLTELLVASVIGLAVMGAAVMMLMAAARTQPETTDRAARIQEGRTLVERIGRELRQGSTVTGASATQLSVITYVGSATCGGAAASTAIQCRVDYSCSGGTCTRSERNPDGSGTPATTQVVSGLSSSNVFNYSPSAADPDYIGISLAMQPAGSSDSIVLTDGVTLRNPSAPQ